MGYTMHVVPHTHWDREWYLTYEQFRIRLVDLIDNLLDILETYPEFQSFNLDGQTIILEDYLQIRPENEEKLRRYIQEGRIHIGPWYVLNDEYLVSGESTVRSLLVGHEIAKSFGNVMKIGYLPDQFGNISQMPQILQEFGITFAVVGRGRQLIGDRKMEFIWESPDGSRVLSSLMAFWYNNAQRFPVNIEDAVKYVEQIRDKMAPCAATTQLLLMNGVDHLEPQRELPDILRRVCEHLKDDRIFISSLPKYAESVRVETEETGIELEVHNGELREDRHNSVLAGTLSARTYLKQANHEAETWLEKYAEPLSSMAWITGLQYPSSFLTYAWKLLMQNHPHDSICGCSIDQVHNEMMPRFNRVCQVAEEISQRAMRHIAANINTEGDCLVVFNTLNWPRTDRLRAIIDFELGDPAREHPEIDPSRDVTAIRLIDSQGQLVPYKLIDSCICPKQVLSPVELPMVVMVRRFTIEFIAKDVPPLGYKVYRIEKASSIPEFDSFVSLTRTEKEIVVRNEYVTLTVGNSGAVTISVNDRSDISYTYQGLPEDGGDVGDEYNYVKPPMDFLVSGLDVKPSIEILDNRPVSVSVGIRWPVRLPISATSDGQGRSAEKVECPIVSWFTVGADSKRVEIATEVENYAKDHRLRVLFPTNIETDVIHVEGAFDVIARSVRPPVDWPDASTFFPMRSWIDVSDGEKGLCIINKGLREYEVYSDRCDRAVAITLLRCVGYLSKGRETPFALPTPGAQCLGKWHFDYAVLPHIGSWEDARVWQDAHQFNVPLVYVQTGAHEGSLPAEHSFVEVKPAELVVTAVKKAEKRNSILVRFFNISEDWVHNARIRVDKAVSARTTNLAEEPGRELDMDAEGYVVVDVPGRKIVTLEFALGG
jgi:alpha-mannosidase